MCDYSLQSVKTRDAAVDDKLVVANFGTGTRGFCPSNEFEDGSTALTAVCVRPGTEIAFDAPIRTYTNTPLYDHAAPIQELPSVAVFAQVNKDQKHNHHDCLQFADGRQVLLTHLYEGQRATVLQLPADPKTLEEAKAQERVEFAG